MHCIQYDGQPDRQREGREMNGDSDASAAGDKGDNKEESREQIRFILKNDDCNSDTIYGYQSTK